MRNEYGITFNGRAKNAIGVTYQITARRIAENEQAAILALYDEYEHIGMPDVRLLKTDVKYFRIRVIASHPEYWYKVGEEYTVFPDIAHFHLRGDGVVSSVDYDFYRRTDYPAPFQGDGICVEDCIIIGSV